MFLARQARSREGGLRERRGVAQQGLRLIREAAWREGVGSADAPGQASGERRRSPRAPGGVARLPQRERGARRVAS